MCELGSGFTTSFHKNANVRHKGKNVTSAELFGDLFKTNQITKIFLLYLAVRSGTEFKDTLYYKAMLFDYNIWGRK